MNPLCINRTKNQTISHTNLSLLCGLISPMRYRIALLLFILLTACVPKVASTPSAVPSAVLIPFTTATPSPTADLTLIAVPPTFTPTPRVHVVASGENLGFIAGRYGVTVAQIVAANPGINANILSIGQKINIPYPLPGSNPTTGGAVVGNPSPTPVVFSLGTVDCYHSLEGGAWCFVLVTNGQGNPIEDVSAEIQLFNSAGQPVASQVTYAMLDIIPPGGTLPIAAYFAAPVAFPVTAKADVRTGTLVPTGDTRYLAATIQSPSVAISTDGLSATVTAQVQMNDPAKGASSIWVAAVAYDSSGRVVGVRRWMSKAGLPAGQSQPVSLIVYSSGAAIARVELAVEARP